MGGGGAGGGRKGDGSEAADELAFRSMRSGREYRSPTDQPESEGEGSESGESDEMGFADDGFGTKKDLVLRELARAKRGAANTNEVMGRDQAGEPMSPQEGLAREKIAERLLADELGSDFVLLPQANAAMPAKQAKPQQQFGLSEDGEAEKAAQVEVPNPGQAVELVPALTPSKAKELALIITDSVDPLDNNEIQILAAIPEDALEAKVASLAPKADSLAKNQFGFENGIIVLKPADPNLKKVEEMVGALAIENNVPVKMFAKIPWQFQVQEALDVRNRDVRRTSTLKQCQAWVFKFPWHLVW
jgi:hypothetical protein